MPDVSLRFEGLKLSCSAERVRLLLTSSAKLRPQDGQFRRVRPHDLLDLMESGKICTTRGPNCKLGFEFSFKNLLLNGTDEKALIEELGRFVLGAPVSLACITTPMFVFVPLKASIVVGTTPSFSFSQISRSKLPRRGTGIFCRNT